MLRESYGVHRSGKIYCFIFSDVPEKTGISKLDNKFLVRKVYFKSTCIRPPGAEKKTTSKAELALRYTAFRLCKNLQPTEHNYTYKRITHPVQLP